MDTALILLLISTLFIGVGVVLWQKGNHLLRNGKRATAIIFKNNYKPQESGDIYYPVVRFLTDKQEWITKELSIGYSPAKEVGAKIEILYDPDDPTYVGINSPFLLEVLPRLFVAVGVVGFVLSGLLYLEVL